MKIVSTSKVQKNISILSDRENIYAVVKNWDPKTLIVPYYDWLAEKIEEILEDFEMEQNREILIKKWEKSLNSGLSDLVI